MPNQIHPEIKKLIDKVKAKRPKTVIDHIVSKGHITTEEIKELYGYNHPPRAARDVRERGIPLETFSVVGSDGRTIAAYRFDDPSKIEHHKVGGRQTFSKQLSTSLYTQQRGRCALTGVAFEKRYLQVDHRLPYEVAGENGRVADESDPNSFMLVSGAANRQKSWSCENCENLKGPKEISVCETCYWASPENYEHTAMRQLRQITLTWEGDEIPYHDEISNAASVKSVPLGIYIKDLLRGE